MRAAVLFLLSFSLLSFPTASSGQTASGTAVKPEQLSPQAAYQDALHPLEVTRHNVANWSDTELAAMNVAIAKAKASCGERTPDQYQGTELVDFARLCSLGQQWPAVVQAASRYIDAKEDGAKPLLTDAYVAKTEALLRLKDEPDALETALTMLHALPYSADVGDCVDEALGYMRFVHTSDALKLASARQPFLLTSLKTVSSAPATPASTASANIPSASALYRQGLLLPELQQLAAQPEEAKASVSTLDAAVQSGTTGDDRIRIAQARRRYALLGKPVTGLHPLLSLSMPYHQLPQLPVHGAITAMLLFPDWCAQCIRMGPRLPSTVFTVEGHSAYVYGLLAQTVPAQKLDPSLTNTAFSPSYAAALMAETPVVTVAPELLQRYEAEDFPLLLIADSSGILRVLQASSPEELGPGRDIDSAIALVGRNFALQPKGAASAGQARR